MPAPRSFRVLSALAPFLLVATGCADQEAPLGAGKQAILGGRKVAANTILARSTAVILDADPDVGQFCTGVVISAALVLTAAHCLDDATRVPMVKLAAGGQPVPVSRAALPVSYTTARREAFDRTLEDITRADEVRAPRRAIDDLALLELASPLGANVRPATLDDGTLDLAAYTLDAVGAGCTSTACDETTGTLRKVPITFARDVGTRMVVMTAGEDHGSCFGDSGGPDVALVSGRPVVVALVSTGPTSCEAGISVDTRIAPYRAWLERARAVLRGAGSASDVTVRRF